MAKYIGPGEPNPKHVFAAALYEDGVIMAELADYFGVSRQRIEQWLSRFEGLEAHYGVCRDPIRMLQEGRKATSLRQAAKKLGVTPSIMEKVLGEIGALRALERLWAWRRTRLRNFSREMTRTKLLEELQTAAKVLGRTPGVRDINQKLGGLSAAHTNYYHLFGSLRNAQIAAGLNPNEVGKPQKKFKGFRHEIPTSNN